MDYHTDFCQSALAVIETELAAIQALKSRINDDFTAACEYLLNCAGRIIVLGMGKSGHIGNKIAATLASTGSPAFFVHAGEASHGDLGMITRNDVVLALSNSGNTPEILMLLPIIKHLGIPLIAMTGKANSPLAKAATITLDVSVAKEACPLNLAPTASTTAALVMGDALAVALLQARQFTVEDFALAHPGGNLGKRLLLKVSDIMHVGDAIPKVEQSTLINQALLEMSAKRLGMTAIVDKHNKVLGVFTDGDLRRTLDKEINIKQTPIKEVMSIGCKTVKADLLAADALQLMEAYKITSLLVTDSENHLVGAFNIHDVFRAGII